MITADPRRTQENALISISLVSGYERETWQDAADLVEEVLDPFDPADRQRIAWLTGARHRKGPPPLPRRVSSGT